MKPLPNKKNDTEMTARETLIQTFLKTHGYEAATRKSMGGDASFRHYERLHLNGKTYILMDAPPPRENVRPFIKIDRFLCGLQLSAPQIIAEDAEAGLLLLEDFGDARYNIHLKQHPEQETELYTRAVEVLVALHKQHQADVPVYDEPLMLKHVSLFLEWYMPHVAKREVSAEIQESFVATWKEIFPHRDAGKPVFTLYDFHADNLMWLPSHTGIKQVGLLDFQDAVIAPPTYDLVSLLQDCRRPVAPAFEKKMLAHYSERTGTSLETSYAVMGAQRHTRILGTFARLATRDKKPHYLDWIPKEWEYLKRNLVHPKLKPLKHWFETHGF